MARSKWLPLAASLLATAALAYAIWSALTAGPRPLLSLPPAALALALSKRRPELAALLALASLAPLLPQADLSAFGPLAPLKGGG